MIRLADINDVVEIDDVVAQTIADFGPVQRLMQEIIKPLARAIKNEWYPFPAAKIKAREIGADISFAIRTTVENEWHQSEYVTPPSADKGKTAFVEQIASLIFAGNYSAVHKQGMRLITTNLPSELADCLHYSGKLLFADVLHAPNQARLDTVAFSPFYRFWHGQVLPKQGVPGVTVAFMLWRHYLESTVPPHLQSHIYEKMRSPRPPRSDELQVVLDTFLDTTTREKIENDLLLLGKLCYRTDLDADAVGYLVQKAVKEKLEPYLWGALATLSPAELAEKINNHQEIPAPAKDAKQETMLALVMLFNELDWAQIDGVLGIGPSIRKTVADILNRAPQLVKLATSHHQVREALRQAQTHGLLPITFPHDNIAHYHPTASMNSIDREVRRIAHQA